MSHVTGWHATHTARGVLLHSSLAVTTDRLRGARHADSNLFVALVGVLIGTSSASAGNIDQVTSRDGDKTVAYEVRSGGGKLMDQFTAFDPESKKFVYPSLERKGKPPAPVMMVWDHRTGETIPHYAVPNVKNPLPAIPSIEVMKVCPVTGDKDFKAKLHIIVD